MTPNPANPRDAMLAAMAGAALAMDGGCTQHVSGPEGQVPSEESQSAEQRHHAYAARDAFIADTAARLARISEAIDAQIPAIAKSGAPDRSVPVLLIEGMRSCAAGIYRRLETAGTASAHEWPAITRACSASIRRLESDAETVAGWLRVHGGR